MSHSRILDGKEKLGHPWFNKTQNTSLRGLLMNKQEHYAAHWVKSLEPNSRVNQLRLALKKIRNILVNQKALRQHLCYELPEGQLALQHIGLGLT